MDGAGITVAAEQEATVRFLADPATHRAPVERVDTHISHLFLTPERAYKLKRAVRTNFLDFSTVARREACCRREIEVNAAVAGAIYLGVVAVVRREGDLHLGGEGEVVDWLVAMRRFDREDEFDRLAERGALDVPLAEALADVVAEMHAGAPRLPGMGGAARIEATLDQIVDAIAGSRQAAGLRAALARWLDRAGTALAGRAGQIEARRRHGLVRRCHGDLHLGNICLLDGRPTPFDALEFNEEMASTDVLYDVAFTVMDLLERGLAPQANAFLARYLGATRDYSGLSLLGLFMSMRAAVRALVAASREEADPHEPTAGARLKFAIRCLDPGDPPRLIAIGGLSGSGKSTLARRIAPGIGGRAGALVLRSDVTRKRLFGVVPEERLPGDAYAPGVSDQVYTRLIRDGGRALRAGASVILDAAFLEEPRREAAEALAARSGVPFTGIWLDCAPDELRRRLAARKGDASDADLAVLEGQLARAPGPGTWTAVTSTGNLDETAADLRLAIAASARDHCTGK